MSYGAISRSGNVYPTKKALREAVKNDPDGVRFFNTSMFASNELVGIDALGPTDVIVGPDPATNRKWYANIKNGKVV